MNTVETISQQPNRYGHEYGELKTVEGYGICHKCGCRENTDQAASPCKNKDRPLERIVSADSIYPSKQAKAAGLKNLSQVIEISGWPRSTLNDMHRNHPKRFRIVLLGCVAHLQANK